MRIPRVRFSMKGLMGAVAALGLAVWLIDAAVRVRADGRNNWLYHYEAASPDGPPDGPSWVGQGHVAPFWPRYWRELLGRPWPGSYSCPCGFEPRPGSLAVSFVAPKFRRPKRGERNEVFVRAKEALERAGAKSDVLNRPRATGAGRNQ
jgi:hypothetical protein